MKQSSAIHTLNSGCHLSMGEINVEIDIREKDVADDIQDAISRGIRKASGRTSVSGLTDQMQEVAEEVLVAENRIWTTELINSFADEYQKTGGGMTIVFSNVADHAAPVEYGAEYGTEGPPIAPLAAWVMSKGARVQPPPDYDRPESDEDMVGDEHFVDGDGNVSSIFEEFPASVLDQAFYLQEHIKEHGIDPTPFMEQAQRWVEQNGADVVAAKIKTEFQKM